MKLVHRFVSCPRQITLLRHPLAHRISLYKYTFQLTPEFFHKQGKTVTLEKYLTWDQNPKGKIATNPLLRTLASRGSHSHPDPRLATPERLEQVKTMLRDQFLFVGLTERFTDSVFLLSRKLGFRPRCHGVYNISTQPAARTMKLSPEVIARFEEKNRLDIELYHYAEQLFERHWGDLSKMGKRHAEIYRLMQHLFQETIHPRLTALRKRCPRIYRRAYRYYHRARAVSRS